MNVESMRVRSDRSIAADEHVPPGGGRALPDIGGVREPPRRGCGEEGALEQVGVLGPPPGACRRSAGSSERALADGAIRPDRSGTRLCGRPRRVLGSAARRPGTPLVAKELTMADRRPSLMLACSALLASCAVVPPGGALSVPRAGSDARVRGRRARRRGAGSRPASDGRVRTHDRARGGGRPAPRGPGDERCRRVAERRRRQRRRAGVNRAV